MFDLFYQDQLQELRRVKNEIAKLLDMGFHDTDRFWELKFHELLLEIDLDISHEKYTSYGENF